MRHVSSNDTLTYEHFSATLGIPLPLPEGKSEPPWAQHDFSYRFTGLPPVEVYELAGLL